MSEWENNTADNVKTMPVMFLASQADTGTRAVRRSTRSTGNVDGWQEPSSGYTNSFFSLSDGDDYGNDDFGAGYAFNANLTYNESTVGTTSYPSAAAFDGTGNEVHINVFGNEIDMLNVDVAADVDGNDLLCSWFEYHVDVLTLHVYGEKLSIANCDNDGLIEYELWNSQDDDGNEKYSISKSKDYEKTFTIGPVPVTVAAGASGELGMKGSVVIDSSYTLTLSAGPYVLLNGYAEGGVGITGFNAGIGVDLLILGVELPFTAALQVLHTYPLAIFTFEAPLIITTLDGELYIFAKILWDEYTYTILEWEGYEWEIPLIDPVWMAWAEPNQFLNSSTNGSPPSLDEVVAELDYNWGSHDPFTASWEGDFDFEPGTYSFIADANEDLEVQLDSDGDGSYDSTLFGVDTTWVIDHAGSHDGTPTNGPNWSSTDVFDDLPNASAGVSGALNFDGTDDYVDLNAGIVNLATADFTLEAWIRINIPKMYGTIISKADGDTTWESGEKAFVIHNGVPYFYNYNENCGALVGHPTASVHDGTWHHVAVVWDYTGGTSGTGKVYVDGDDVTYSGSDYTAGCADNSGNTLKIGIPIDYPRFSYFPGKMDEVRIWDVARSQSEIQADMYRQLAGNETGLEAYYRFDSRNSIDNGASFSMDITEDTVAGFQVDYENQGGSANLSLSWSKHNTFNARYYNNTSLSGDAVLTVLEEGIDHDWGASSPDDEASVNADSFSARWEGTFDFYGSSSQDMVFVVESDDSGVELYVDSSQITLTATNEADTYYGVVDDVTAGPHDLKLEYVHSSGDAKIKLSWLPAGAWFVVPYHRDNGSWELFDDPSIETSINSTSNNQTGTKDMLWDYRGFFNFTQAGDYDFIVRADDGIKLIIDGEEYLGHWSIDEATAYIVPVTLTAGYHLIHVEHYDEQTVQNNYMVREVAWSLRENNEFIGFYYSTLDDMEADDPWDADTYDGTEPLVIGKTADAVTGCTFTSSSLVCDWSASTPTANLDGIDSTYLNTDSFGVRWIGDFDFTQGVYVFTAKVDDGVRLWVDDVIVIDQWNTTATRTYQEAVPMSTGAHNIRIEYWESSGKADIAVSWSEISQDTFNAQYFTTTDLSGTATDGGTVSSISGYTGTGSARWVGVFEFEETDYDFTITTDGTAQLYVDGAEVIGLSETSATLPLEAGFHSVKVEYFAGTSITVDWSGSSEIAGNALEFDGTDDYVSVPYDAALNPNEFTFETWAYVTGGSDYRTVMSNRTDGSYVAATIYAGNNNKWQFWLGNGSNWNGKVTGSTIELNTWTHLAGTYDGSTMYFYIDGVLQSSLAVSQAKNTSNPFTIGVQTDGTSFPFVGTLDEVRIWNTARSQAEIQAYMKSTLNGDESNLVAYYQFDESSGTTATDSTTGGYDGTLNGDPQWVTSDTPLTELPAPGSALSFDGSGDYVKLSDFTGITGTNARTAEAWIKTTTDYEAIISWGTNNGGEKWVFRTTSAGRLRVEVNGGSIEGTTSVTDGAWHHVACTFEDDGSPNVEDVKLYLDGVLEVISASSAKTINTADGANVKIGTDFNNRYFSGEMDEVRIWDVARSKAEIQAYMNRTLDSDESGLLAYYNFDEKAGSSIAVLSDIAGSNNGTLNGNPTWVDSDATLSKLIAPGNALEFDGSGDSVTLPYILDPAADSFTAETWFKVDSLSGDQYLIQQENGTGSGHTWLALDSSGYLFQWLSSKGVADTAVSANTWHHAALVYDTNAETLTVYLDGESVNTTTSVTSVDAADGDLVVGMHRDGNSYFHGTLDEMRIWNVARTQTEIQADMYRALGSFESGLAAYYRFDQDSGTELIDVSSHDHDGTINGSPTWLASDAMTGINPPGNAMTFDGTDDYVEVANHADLEFGANSFSVEAWVKADGNSAGDYRNIVSKKLGGGSAAGWVLRLNNSLQPEFFIADGSTGLWTTSSSAATTGTWVHLTGVVDRATETATLYVNGEEAAFNSTTNITTVNSGVAMRMGTWSNINTDYWLGDIDEVRIWDVARTKTEIQADMNSALTGSESGLVAYYNFDDTDGDLIDITGSSHDGTLNGGPTWAISGVPMD